MPLTPEFPPFLPYVLMTAGLVVLLFVFRAFFLKRISSWNVASYDVKRRWIVQVRNLSVGLFLLGLLIIWSPFMKTFAFSLTALAVAFVIATKELILCLMGGLLKVSARPFQIGDRIEVGHNRGDVIDQGLFTTTLFEIGPEKSAHQYTGRILVLPNSIFLNQPVVNEAFTQKYALHTFVLPLRLDDDWKLAERTVLQAAEKECRDFLDDCHTYFTTQRRSEGLDPPSVRPRVNLHIESPDHLDLVVRIPCPLGQKGRLEQAIVRRYLEARQSGGGSVRLEG